ncbi:hypothetical protein Q5P01_000680 [Channa striata]|uniref:Uncharacterized protein n=1 Tax=Channa striata TaxID=64152 RepID=A0AA88IKU3_CHASR|nr:hypothetical protein Q5P01_000680 [Channa striata]
MRRKRYIRRPDASSAGAPRAWSSRTLALAPSIPSSRIRAACARAIRRQALVLGSPRVQALALVVPWSPAWLSARLLPPPKTPATQGLGGIGGSLLEQPLDVLAVRRQRPGVRLARVDRCGEERRRRRAVIAECITGSGVGVSLVRGRERVPLDSAVAEFTLRSGFTSARPSTSIQQYDPGDEGCGAGCWSIVESNPELRENFDIWVRGRGCTVQYVVRQVDDSATSRSFLYTLSRFNDIPIVAHTRDDILELCKNDALLDDGEDARRDYEMIRRAERDPLRRGQGDRGLRSADGAEHKRPHIYVDPANGSTAPFHLAEGDLKGLRRGMMDMTLSSGGHRRQRAASLDPYAAPVVRSEPPEVRRDLKPKALRSSLAPKTYAEPRFRLSPPTVRRDLKPRRTTDFDGARPDDRRETGCRRPGVDSRVIRIRRPATQARRPRTRGLQAAVWASATDASAQRTVKSQDDKPPGFSADIVEECLRKSPLRRTGETQGSEAFHVRRLTEACCGDAASERLIKPIRKPQKTLSLAGQLLRCAGASGSGGGGGGGGGGDGGGAPPQAIRARLRVLARAVPAEKAAPALLVGASWGGAASALSRTGGGRAEARSVRHLPCEASLPGEKRTGEDFTENPSGLLPCEESVKIEVPRLSVRARDRPSRDRATRPWGVAGGTFALGRRPPAKRIRCEENSAVCTCEWTGQMSPHRGVPINSSATSTTSTLPFTQVKTEELEQDRVAPARDPSAQAQTDPWPLDHVDSYLPIEKMFSGDTRTRRSDNAEDRDRDYEEVVAYMQNQGLYFEDFIGRWNKPGSCWLSDGPKGVVFEDSTDDETGGGLRLDPGGRQRIARRRRLFFEGHRLEKAQVSARPGGLQRARAASFL